MVFSKFISTPFVDWLLSAPYWYAQNWKIQQLIWGKYLIKVINTLTTDQLSPTVGKLSINPPPEWQLQRHFPETLKPSDVMAKFKGKYVVCAEHGVRRGTFIGIQTVKQHSLCLYWCFKIFHDKQDFWRSKVNQWTNIHPTLREAYYC